MELIAIIFLPVMSDSALQPLSDEAGNLESISYKDVDSKNLASSASAPRSKYYIMEEITLYSSMVTS